MSYKPGILNQSQFNPPEEVKSIAQYCAKRGIKGNLGDALPIGITGDSLLWINSYQRVFRHMIARGTA